ncbi:unnamed protein product [Vitrella brassicaformis CCMP3155]|uniref:Nuclear speckle splicing regulatory protein 1 N-terminal domain-containing protein n=1 Tax=Vitrella brassicaformis (strain CCMP3155) TaxID=1169540 RepID=A0A0G4G6C2_VITBC|nr:unnamed protein product [Vitrella brassicaformis CCMP3155]|eukprot:CEM24009.1 unnamed protein product [Vitrella brassicaformis CCMP3155]
MSASKLKFGLNLPAKKANQPPLPSSRQQQSAAGVSALFAQSMEDEAADDEQGRRGQFRRMVQTQAGRQKRHEEEHQKMLEVDPTIFSYDDIYDNISSQQRAEADKQLKRQQQEERAAEEAAGKKKAKPKSRYIESLQRVSQRRQMEQEIIEERNLKREQERDAELYADKDKFITSAYKKKLEERRQLERELAMQDARDTHNEVTKKENLTDFHSHLLKHNLASRHVQPPPAKPATDDTPPAAPVEREEGASSAAAVGNMPEDKPSSPRPDKRPRDGDEHEAEAPPTAAGQPLPSTEQEEPAAAQPAPKKPKKDVPAAPPELSAEEKARQEAERKTAVLSARERYLQRKKQQEAGEGQSEGGT